ncbi:MAG: hypothetical protein RL160_13 [Bacteroidota bacterium]|jgi:uncharacterized protein with HEPN domain
MSIHHDQQLLKHILEETSFLLHHTGNLTKDEFLTDEVLCRATIRSLEVIGEATKKLTDAFKTRHDVIEWKKIAGNRDKLIHDYYGIDYEIVWDILTSRIQQLHNYILEIQKA